MDFIYLMIKEISKKIFFWHIRKQTKAKHFSLTENQLQAV
jgi:hypothetical protein